VPRPWPLVGATVRIQNPVSHFHGRQGTVQAYVWTDIPNPLLTVWLPPEDHEAGGAVVFGLDECELI
jgi:hypothetical protein